MDTQESVTLQGNPTLKTALVTGATSGIGEALCRLLARQRIDLIITGRDEAKLSALTEELKQHVHVFPIKADLIQERQEVLSALKEYKPELVVNNAGFGLYGEVFDHSTQEEMDLMELNSNALLQITLEAVKTLKAAGKKGVVLNVSSAAGFLPFPCFTIYSATKAFVNHLSVSLDEELKRYGIRVLAACPGMVGTSFRERATKKEGVAPGAHSMDADEAAQHIWRQIVKGKQINIFNWKTRLMIFAARYLLPRALLMKILRDSIEKITN